MRRLFTVPLSLSLFFSLSLSVCVGQSLSVLIASVLFAFNFAVWLALVARIPLINYRTDSPDLAAASGFAVLLLCCPGEVRNRNEIAAGTLHKNSPQQNMPLDWVCRERESKRETEREREVESEQTS